MKTLLNTDFTIDKEDVAILLVNVRYAYKNHTLEQFEQECKQGYVSYLNTKRDSYKTYSQWINGQIISSQ